MRLQTMYLGLEKQLVCDFFGQRDRDTVVDFFVVFFHHVFAI